MNQQEGKIEGGEWDESTWMILHTLLLYSSDGGNKWEKKYDWFLWIWSF
jgi:hypothetical protein